MTKGKVFLYFCLSFVGGIFLSSLVNIPQEVLWGFFILGSILIFSLWKHKKFIVVGVCLILIAAGIFRHQQTVSQVSEIARHNNKGQVVLKGVVVGEPDIRFRSTNYEVRSKKIIFNEQEKDISGKVLATAPRYPEYKYGDELELVGGLKTPTEDLDGFNYKDYLSREGIYSTMFWPEIKKVSENNGNFIYAKILDFKNSLRESIYRTIPPPQSEILGAVLLGDKRKLSDILKEKLNITGTRHITAISGMHITIIIGILIQLFLLLRFWKKQAFYLSILAITLFIIMVGAPSSAIRAGIMAGALYFAETIGRPRSSPRAILYAAVIILFINPQLLRFDIGFQLSFLAVMGIAFFRDWFNQRLKFLPEILNIRGIGAMTLSAQLATLPILIYNFGRISFISVFANVLIVPTLPFIMIGGFISGFTGIFVEKIGQIISWPVWLVLTYVSSIIDFFASLPFASKIIEDVHWIWIIPYYIFLFWFWKKFIQHRVFVK